jgi:hypothetical protein
MMEYDAKTNEWFIPHLDDNVKEDNNGNPMLAMGFNDDEECIMLFKVVFNQNLVNNDIKLSMMLDMNNPPKNVYFSYEEKAKKKGAVITNKRPGTGKRAVV